MKQFFLAHAYLEQQMNDEALDIYNELQNAGFNGSSYLLAQKAIVFHNKRGDLIRSKIYTLMKSSI